jgi:5,10-methylenetetrahydrofolate reductase
MDADIDLLKAKIDAGATRAITQFVFDTRRICVSATVWRRQASPFR